MNMTNELSAALSEALATAIVYEPAHAATLLALGCAAGIAARLRKVRRHREGERVFAAYRRALAEASGTDHRYV